MKTKNRYSNRLLWLASHLGENQLNQELFNKEIIYSCDKAGCNIEHFNWALSILPKIEPMQ